jgi:hypothetical protein
MARGSKAAQPANSGNGSPAPSPQEAMLFFNIIKNMKNKPEIDWQGVAEDNGFKNAETAKVNPTDPPTYTSICPAKTSQLFQLTMSTPAGPLRPGQAQAGPRRQPQRPQDGRHC